MSADGWAICPLCVEDAKAEHGRKIADLNEAYGKIPAAEWRERDEALPAEFDPEAMEHTVREDYEIGFEGTDPEVNQGWLIYKGVCAKCGAEARIDTTLRLVRTGSNS